MTTPHTDEKKPADGGREQYPNWLRLHPLASWEDLRRKALPVEFLAKTGRERIHKPGERSEELYFKILQERVKVLIEAIDCLQSTPPSS